jgi:hypothetical protein
MRPRKVPTYPPRRCGTGMVWSFGQTLTGGVQRDWTLIPTDMTLMTKETGPCAMH